ncbi:manganese catalase family protein [Nocardiopsis alba]|uniref:manganese catalase family protein n=1 Tax=Nocardiopsis alba TaxID=53437 RepID=UPI0033A35B14
MFRHTEHLQCEAKPEAPDALYAMKLQELIGDAVPTDSAGTPLNGKYVVARGNLLADFRANVAAEAQGRLQTARLYNMTDDPGFKEMLQFNLARDTVHQNMWPAAIAELQEDGLEGEIAPDALHEEEDQEHANTIWGLSDGTAAAEGRWASRPTSDGEHELRYLDDPEPLGGPTSVPPPDPELYGTFAGPGDEGSVQGAGKATKSGKGPADKVKEAFE